MLRLFTAVFSLFGDSLKPFGGLLGAILDTLGGTLGPHAFLERVSWGPLQISTGGPPPFSALLSFPSPLMGFYRGLSVAFMRVSVSCWRQWLRKAWNIQLLFFAIGFTILKNHGFLRFWDVFGNMPLVALYGFMVKFGDSLQRFWGFLGAHCAFLGTLWSQMSCWGGGLAGPLQISTGGPPPLAAPTHLPSPLIGSYRAWSVRSRCLFV